MILPSKHITLSNSLISLSAEVYKSLSKEETVSSLWTKTRLIPQISTYERYTLALDLLFILGLIEFKEGLLNKT